VRFKNSAEKYGFNKLDAVVFNIGEVKKLNEILD
jgi:hypothetical protein